ncbi:MAG: formate dehydrogenase subunit alpha, partial [Chloroflexota bacterium]
ILQLMLASHPDTCMVCNKGNRCQLREMAAELGIGLLELERIPQPAVIQEVNPFIERDLSKCVLCAKCIRADHELVVEGAIDYLERGFTSRPATLHDLALENSTCTFCGTCVAICPTGALREKGEAYQGTTAQSVKTVCPFCGCGCAVSLEVKDNRLVRVRPAEGSPINRNTLCIRGAYGYDFVHHPDRLTAPLIREDGNLKDTSWDEALGQVATEFRRIKDTYGPESLAVLGSSKCTNEENYILQRFARGVLGTNNIDNGSRLYGASGRVGLGWTLGIPGTTSSLRELELCDVVMVVGADPTSSAPAVGYAIKRAVRQRGARLVLIDPRRTRLTPFAECWLRPKLGTDTALINGIGNVIVTEKLYDEEFVTRRTDNFTELTSLLKGYSPPRVAKITGISAADLQSAARLFAGGERAAIVFGNGITQQAGGTNGVMALVNLAMLTGNIERRGGGIFALQRENNAQGACDMGSLPDFLPGYQRLDDKPARKMFEQRWQVSLPEKAGLSALEIVQRAAAGNIKGMLIVGENPVSSFPDPDLVRQALASLEFLVVSDMFLTPTAEEAAVVLPAASFAEKEGTFTNFEGRVQQVHRAIAPPAGSMADWEIINSIARKMAAPLPYTCPRDIMDEIEALVPLYRRSDSTGFEAEDTAEAGRESSHLETRRLYNGPFPSGFRRFCPVEYRPPKSGKDKEYPFELLVGSLPQHLGSGTRSLRASRLKKYVPDSRVEIGHADAKKLAIKSGDTVRVVSGKGEVSAAATLVDTLPRGMLFIPISFPKTPVGGLFDINLDPLSGGPSFKSCRVRLERGDNEE